MPSVNQVFLMGHITRDPQLKFLPSQTAVCEFGIAANRHWTKDGEKQEEVTFVDLVAFGKQAEVINQYCKKGDLFHLRGRLKYDTWEDKQTGAKRSKLSVVVEDFQLMGNRQAEGGSGERQPPRQTQRPQRPANDAPPRPFGEEKEFDPSDIPF
jgi:single-strand DNA-binding protein